jgi:hypothetical protein
MKNSQFIKVSNIVTKDQPAVQYVNTAHILRVYEENNKVSIELTDFTTLEISGLNIHVILDQFLVD